MRVGRGETVTAAALVSPDALALVRFGLMAPDDPRILNTVRVIDALLEETTAEGDLWRRYNGDGYGVHEDCAPFRRRRRRAAVASADGRTRALRVGSRPRRTRA